jgi:hypothetical protein
MTETLTLFEMISALRRDRACGSRDGYISRFASVVVWNGNQRLDARKLRFTIGRSGTHERTIAEAGEENAE